MAEIATTFRFGCPHWAELPPEVENQLRLASKLRERLVWLQECYEEAVAEAWRQHPDFAELDKRLEEAKETVRALVERVKAERVADRSTRPRAGTKAELAAARDELKGLRLIHKERKQTAWPDVKGTVDGARHARDAAVKKAYGDFVQGAGLYWATYNDVVAHWKTSIKQVAERRKRGEAAALRYPRWDGEGTITVQLQRQAGDPPRTPALLASGKGAWKNVVQLRPWVDPADWATMTRAQQRKEARGELLFTIGLPPGASRASKPRIVSLPVVVHRMMPAEADITMVRITRTKVAGKFRLSVAVTALVPAPEPRPSGEIVSVRPRWKTVELGDGRPIQVATIATASGDFPPVPRDLEQFVSFEDGLAVVRLPQRLRDVWARAGRIRRYRDEALNEIKPKVAAALREDPALVELTGMSPRSAAALRSCDRLAAVERVWPSGHPLAVELAAWRIHDRHLRDFGGNESDQLAAHRRDIYRKVAAWALTGASHVSVTRYDLRSIRSTPEVGREDTYQERGGRRAIQIGAPGDLFAAIANYARHHGVAFYEDTQDPTEDE